jgi:hypothetical protein
VAAGVGLAAVGPRRPPVEVEPAVEQGVGGVPGHRRVVAVARGDDPAGAAGTAHLPQRRHRVGEVLEHLVGVDGVEARVLDGERVGVSLAVLEGGEAAGIAPRRRQHLGGAVEADHPAGGDAAGQVGGDRPRAAADVEQVGSRRQPVEQVGARVGGAAPAVRAQHALVVAVGVGLGHPAWR